MVVRELAVKLGLQVDEAAFARGKAAADSLAGVLSKAVTQGNLIAKAVGMAINVAANAVRGLDDALIGFNARAEQSKMGLAGIAGMNLKLPWEEAKRAADAEEREACTESLGNLVLTLALFNKNIFNVFFSRRGKDRRKIILIKIIWNSISPL